MPYPSLAESSGSMLCARGIHFLGGVFGKLTLTEGARLTPAPARSLWPLHLAAEARVITAG